MTPLQKKMARFNELLEMIELLGLEKVARGLVHLSGDGEAKYTINLHRMTQKEVEGVIEKCTTSSYDTSKYRCQVIGGKISASLWIWRELGGVDTPLEKRTRCDLSEAKVKIEIEGWLEQNKNYCERNNDE